MLLICEKHCGILIFLFIYVFNEFFFHFHFSHMSNLNFLLQRKLFKSMFYLKNNNNKNACRIIVVIHTFRITVLLKSNSIETVLNFIVIIIK